MSRSASRDRLGGLERAAAGEHREAREQPLLVGRQQVVAPVDRLRASVCWRGSASRPPRRGRAAAPSRSRIWLGRERAARAAASSTASGRLSSARRARAIVVVGREARPLAESSTRLASASGRHRDSTSPRTRSSSRLVTSTWRFGHAATSAASSGAAVDDLLEVVEHEQQLRRSPMCAASAVLARRASARSSRRRARVAQRCEPDPEDAGRELGDELGRRLDREPRLAGAARPGQRDEASAVARSAPRSAATLAVPPDERARRARQVRVRDRLQRRERSAPSWKSAHRRVEVLEPVLAEVDERLASASARASPPRAATCPPWPVAAMRAPRCTSRADIALGGQMRRRPCARPIRTRIGPPRAPAAPPRPPRRASGASAKAAKNASPCVSTSTPPCARERLAQDAAMLGERRRVARRRARAAAASSPRRR